MFDLMMATTPDGRTYAAWVLSGLSWTLALALLGWAIAFSLGVVVGAARCSLRPWVALLGRLYVEIFRNIPLLVQMFLGYFVLPDLLPGPIGDWIKTMPPPWGNFVPAVLSLGLYTASRVAEQVRAGIEALPAGQSEAAQALGLRGWQVQRLVILPQALRLIIPSLTSEVMGIYKNTSVALAVGVMELTAQARQISEMTFQTFPAFAIVTVIYVALALIVWVGMSALEARLSLTAPPRRRRRAVPAMAEEPR